MFEKLQHIIEKRYFLETLTHDPDRPLDENYGGVHCGRGTYGTVEEAKASAEIVNALCARKTGAKVKPIKWGPGVKTLKESVATSYVLYSSNYEVVYFIHDLDIVREEIKEERKKK